MNDFIAGLLVGELFGFIMGMAIRCRRICEYRFKSPNKPSTGGIILHSSSEGACVRGTEIQPSEPWPRGGEGTD